MWAAVGIIDGCTVSFDRGLGRCAAGVDNRHGVIAASGPYNDGGKGRRARQLTFNIAANELPLSPL